MYYNNFFNISVPKDDTKNNKIFRPWDVSKNKEVSQDCTISTTTDDIQERIKLESKHNDNSCDSENTKGFRLPQKPSSSSPSLPTINDYHMLPIDTYPNVYPPEYFQTNLAQSLGLPTNDPFIIESLTQGYAFEEYARVLSQEHQAKLMNARKQRPKKYKCPHCDVGFSNNGQLKGHIRIHTGERPFKCDEEKCGKTFTRNEELTRHKRIHSGLRPFPCTHCGKRFGRKDHLKKHSRTHLQPRGLYAVPVMLPLDQWTAASAGYPYVPMFGY